MFSCAAGREEHCKQISLVCVGIAHSVWVTLGLPPLTECVLSGSTLLRLQVALPANCLRWALGCVHFPYLCRSGSRVQTQLGLCFVRAFCALPRSEQLRQPGAWRAHTPQVRCILAPPRSQPLGFLGAQRHLRCAMCLFWGADLWL